MKGSRLGGMGVPIKLTIGGQAVFVCCNACKDEAAENPAQTLDKVAALKGNAAAKTAAAAKAAPATPANDRKEAKIKAALANCQRRIGSSPKCKKFCPVLENSRLGSMGRPVKLMIEGRPVFICCDGCQEDALANPRQTLAKVEKAKKANSACRQRRTRMIEKIIELSIRNRFLVLIVAAALTVAGIYAVLNTPVDAIPDLSENQVIVFTDWMGRSPREIEDQVTYPLSRKLQGLAGVRRCDRRREFNFSMITIIFEDNIDFYFARQRVTEKLAQANTFLPAGVVPYLAPDATALGQIFWYTVEASPSEPDRSVTALGVEQVLYRSADQRRAGRGRRGRRRRHCRWNTRSTCGPRPCGPTASRWANCTPPSARATCRPAAASCKRTTPSTSSAASAGSRTSKDIENTVIKEVDGTPIYVKNDRQRAAGHAVSPQRLRKGRQRSGRRRRADAARRKPAGRHRARQGEDPGAAAGPARGRAYRRRPTTARG